MLSLSERQKRSSVFALTIFSLIVVNLAALYQYKFLIKSSDASIRILLINPNLSSHLKEVLQMGLIQNIFVIVAIAGLFLGSVFLLRMYSWSRKLVIYCLIILLLSSIYSFIMIYPDWVLKEQSLNNVFKHFMGYRIIPLEIVQNVLISSLIYLFPIYFLNRPEISKLYGR